MGACLISNAHLHMYTAIIQVWTVLECLASSHRQKSSCVDVVNLHNGQGLVSNMV